MVAQVTYRQCLPELPQVMSTVPTLMKETSILISLGSTGRDSSPVLSDRVTLIKQFLLSEFSFLICNIESYIHVPVDCGQHIIDVL